MPEARRDSTQNKLIATPDTHSSYRKLDYLDTDMLFLRYNKNISPQKYEELTNDFDEKGTGVFKNKMVASPNKNAMFDGFATKFNDYIRRESNWRVYANGKDDGKRDDGSDEYFELLKFAGAVDGRLTRDQDNATTQYAYSKSTKLGEKDHEITYSYKLHSDLAVDKDKVFTHDGGDGQYANSKRTRNNLAVNHQNAIKWLAWQVRRFIEAQKQDLQNRYMSYENHVDNFLYPEFDDVHKVDESYGIMFFVEGTRYIAGDIPDFEHWRIGNIIIGEYNIGDDGYNGDVDVIDPNNTTVWYSQFDLTSISTHTYGGEDFLDITIVIPEGIALNNEAQIAQVNTLGKTGGASVKFSSQEKEETKKTYQVDGLVQKGLPKNFVAKFQIQPTQDARTNYWRNAYNRMMSIVGIAKWSDDGMSIQDESQRILITTDGKYGTMQPFKHTNGDYRYLPGDYIGTKIDTGIIGSLNRIIYRTPGGFNLKFERYAQSLDLNKKFPLATILAIKTDYWTAGTQHLFKNRNIELLGNNHYYSVTMRPVKPIYTHPITGYYGDPMPHATYLRKLQDVQKYVLNYTTMNPDYTIFTNDGRVVDIRYTNSGQRSILYKSDYLYFDYDNMTSNGIDYGYGTIHVLKDMPRAWLTTSNLDLRQGRGSKDNDPVQKNSGKRPMRPGKHAVDYEDWEYFAGWDEQELQPMRVLDGYLNNGDGSDDSGKIYHIKPYNSPETLNNYVDLKKGDDFVIRWRMQDQTDMLPTSVRLTFKDPAKNLRLLEDDYTKGGQINAEFDFPLFGKYDFNTDEGTGDVSKESLWLGNAIPTINGVKRLYAGQNANGEMNKIEVESNKLDLSTVPVNMGIVLREMRYI